MTVGVSSHTTGGRSSLDKIFIAAPAERAAAAERLLGLSQSRDRCSARAS